MPGTQLEKRLQRGDKGVDSARGIDAVAKRHDIAYSRARTKEDIRRADNKMIEEVKRSTAGSKTKFIVLSALRAKKLGEDIGVTDVNTFTPGLIEGGQLPADRLLKDVLRKLKLEKKNKRSEDIIQKIIRKTKKDAKGGQLFGVIASIALPFIIKGIKKLFKKKKK